MWILEMMQSSPKKRIKLPKNTLFLGLQYQGRKLQYQIYIKFSIPLLTSSRHCGRAVFRKRTRRKT